MAVEGKLRSLIVQLNAITKEKNLVLRPFAKVDLVASEGMKQSRIEIGLKQRCEDPSLSLDLRAVMEDFLFKVKQIIQVVQ
jgi:hypothetical protein